MARAIIDQEFCASEPLRLTRNNGEFTAKGVNKEYKFTFDGHQLKSAGQTLLTLQLNPCKVFEGNGNGRKIFMSVDRSTCVVSLAGSSERYKIAGKWGDQSCVISRINGGSSNIIAQKDQSEKMNVYPGKNCALVVALVVVREKID